MTNKFLLSKSARAKLNFFLTVTVLIAPGCANESAWDEEKHAVAQVVSNPSLRAAVLPGVEMNEYKVSLDWDAGLAGKPYLVSRLEKLGKPETFPVDSKTPNAFTDSAVSPGHIYNYAVHYMVDGVSQQIDATPVEIPRDIRLSGIQEVFSMKVGRLYLEKDALLLTFGKTVQIDADEIISEDATIRVFPELDSAKTEESKHPGAITVNARSANGRLTVDARGKPGLGGVDGADGTAGIAGANGVNGRNGLAPELRAQFGPDFSYYQDLEINRLQDGITWPGMPKREHVRETKDQNRIRFICITQPGDGGDGLNGLPGGDAGDGQDGGDSAPVVVTVARDAGFQVTVANNPGLGGAPGVAGKGGAGGAAGTAGKRDYLERGRIAADGKSGGRGVDGRPGRQGHPGIRKPYRVTIGDRTISE